MAASSDWKDYPGMRKHADCEDKCQLLEHKGYHSCSQTGECAWLSDQARAFADAIPPSEGKADDADLEWLHRFLNCTVFGPPPSEIQRAHQIVDALAARSAIAPSIRYTPVAPTEVQRQAAWDSGLANIGDVRLVWVNEGDFWHWNARHQEMLPSIDRKVDDK